VLFFALEAQPGDASRPRARVVAAAAGHRPAGPAVVVEAAEEI